MAQREQADPFPAVRPNGLFCLALGSEAECNAGRAGGVGIRTVMITGDNPRTVAAITREAGVDDFLAEATPERKMRLIILPAMFIGVYPEIAPLNIMGLASPHTAILSVVIFNALIIVLLFPQALKGVRCRPRARRLSCGACSCSMAWEGSSRPLWASRLSTCFSTSRGDRPEGDKH